MEDFKWVGPLDVLRAEHLLERMQAHERKERKYLVILSPDLEPSLEQRRILAVTVGATEYREARLLAQLLLVSNLEPHNHLTIEGTDLILTPKGRAQELRTAMDAVRSALRRQRERGERGPQLERDSSFLWRTLHKDGPQAVGPQFRAAAYHLERLKVVRIIESNPLRVELLKAWSQNG